MSDLIVAEMPEQNWLIQKMCTDIENYELSVEKQKRRWQCEQSSESWKWTVSFHGTVVATGYVYSALQAQALAVANVPAATK